MNAKQQKAWGWRKSALALAIASTLSINPVFAAETSGGSLKGVVTNSSGVAVSSASIVLRHKDKGITRTVSTNEKGEYLLRNLPVGEYELVFSKDGFSDISAGSVKILVGRAAIYDGQLVADGANMETIEVLGTMKRLVDTGSSTAGIVVTQEQMAALPIGNGFEAMAVLAPGVASSSRFDASSFGGASSAENIYYLNGINVSTIRRGIGSIPLPWEAVEQTEVKTGAINPEFGGALGGVVNAVSKSGGNDFDIGGSYRIDPNAMHANHDSVFDSDGNYAVNTDRNALTFQEANIWASGAIIDDKLFFYGNYNPRVTDDEWADGSSFLSRTANEDRWFVTLDYQLSENHRIDVTSINYEREGDYATSAYSPDDNSVGAVIGKTKFASGGKVYGAHYSGQLTDAFSVDVVAGRTVETVYNRATSDLPGVWDCRNGSCVAYSSHSDSSIKEEEYTRDQFKVDLRYDLENHALQLGIDTTALDVDYLETQNGAGDAKGWWTIDIAGVNDISGAALGETYIEQRIRDRGTSSTVDSKALYLQDSWQVTDTLMLNVGARYETFENAVTGGEKYVDTNGLSPRLQAIWDVNGDGDTKVFASFGRYYQPVSANMNITQGSYSREVFEYYEPDQLDANGRPLLGADGAPSHGAAYRDTYVRQAGIVEPALIASGNLKGMYNDEFTLGFETLVADGMVLGVRGVYRDLKRSIEDTDIAPVLAKYLADNGITDNVGQGSYYVLHNPGEDLAISYDFDQNGTVEGAEHVTLSAADLQLPTPERKYLALETSFKGYLREDLYVDASYVLSHSYGNTEGLVRTDNDQADPGWTTSYDYADLMDHGKGDLPNDHRHAFKLSGFYNITDDLVLGMVSSFVSGAPKNYFSVHPEGVDSCATGSPWEDCISRYYGAASFYDENGKPAPRGSAGRLGWVFNMDMSLAYGLDLSVGHVNIKGTVYNVFNTDTAIAINEERSINDAGSANGLARNPNYGLASERQSARFMSLEARYEF